MLQVLKITRLRGGLFYVVDSRISQKAGIPLVVVNLTNFDKIQTGALIMIYHHEHKCNTF